MFDTPVLPRLETLLGQVRDGVIQIPAVQRGFVWDPERRLKLMDSLEKGLPIGSLLVWRTRTILDLKVEARLGPYLLPKAPDSQTRNYLLDGLQRVTTLYAALIPSTEAVAVAGPEEEDNIRWPIYYDLDPPGKSRDDLRFRLPHANRLPPDTWLPLNIIFDYDAVLSFVEKLRKIGKGALHREVRRIVSSFHDYVIPVIPLVTDDLTIAATSFARINSQAKSMEESDMVRALTLARGLDLSERFAKLKSQLAPLGWGGAEPSWIINSLKIIAGLDVYRASPTQVRDLLVAAEDESSANHTVTFSRLTTAWLIAARVLRSFGVKGPASAPYAFQVMILVNAAYYLGEEVLGGCLPNLEQWFFDLAYRESFTGITGSEVTQVAEDLVTMLETRASARTNGVVYKIAPTRLRTNSVRSRLFLLVTARAADEAFLTKTETEDSVQSRTELLGAEGAACVHPIFPDVSRKDPANRVIATPNELQRLRMALSGHLLSIIHDKDYKRLNISRFAVERLFQLGPKGFCEQRSAELNMIEKEFVLKLGLHWDD